MSAVTQSDPGLPGVIGTVSDTLVHNTSIKKAEAGSLWVIELHEIYNVAQTDGLSMCGKPVYRQFSKIKRWEFKGDRCVKRGRPPASGDKVVYITGYKKAPD